MPYGTRVVHLNKAPYTVDVSRGGEGGWGNPYTHKLGTRAQFVVATRKEAVEGFRRYCVEHPELVARMRRELRGEILGCWCAPNKLCHAEVIAEICNCDDDSWMPPAPARQEVLDL